MTNVIINPPTQIQFPPEIKNNPGLLKYHQAVQTFQFQIWQAVTDQANSADSTTNEEILQLVSSFDPLKLRSNISTNTSAINALALIVANNTQAIEDNLQLIVGD